MCNTRYKLKKFNDFYSKVLGAEIIVNGKEFSYRFGNTQLNCQGPNVNVTEIAKIPVEPRVSD